MVVGDLVKMKYDVSRKLHNRKNYTRDVGIVYGRAAKGIKVLMPDCTIKLGLVEHWEVVGVDRDVSIT